MNSLEIELFLVWRFHELVDVEDYQFFIFDRWGELLFETNNISNGWNGTFKGEDVPSGLYVWKIKFMDPVSQQSKNLVGKVTKIK